MAAYIILHSQNFKFLVTSEVAKASPHHHTKFHQNLSNDCRVIAFNGIQNGGQLPFWISTIIENLVKTEKRDTVIL